MSVKTRLDHTLVARGLVSTRSQAESYIRLEKVTVNGEIIKKPGYFVSDSASISLIVSEQYVSRAGLKLASVTEALGLHFKGKTVLDVGSSTGGFTDYALQHGARLVYAVDVGTGQLHPSLRGDGRISLHEKTDIRQFVPEVTPDIILVDVSFISLRQIIPHLVAIAEPSTLLVAMVKPQFEAERGQINRGVVKNDRLRRQILRAFEQWVTDYCRIADKQDSDVAGEKGNRERFYLLRTQRHQHNH